MNACIYFIPEAYTTAGPRLMGRNAAGASFLRGFLTYSQSTEFWVFVQKPEDLRQFALMLQASGRKEPVKAVDKNTLGGLREVGAVYLPGPGIGEHAFHRAAYGHGAWSLCGITHTTSSAGVMSALVDLVCAPVHPWDAVICTSTTVKNNIEHLLQAQVDYLKSRLGITKLILPQLPVIPLGIHSQDFTFTGKQRIEARAALGVAEQSLVVLFTGRLSFHAKAHPLAMYQALEAAAKETGKSVVLIECGWHANESIAKAYTDAAKLACPRVHLVTLDGRKMEDRQVAYAGADVFCSLSDNIQETFGLTPIEAMAAGLPVVVSDWDGYKDTVRDGVDGFRIPTLMPGNGLGRDLALRHALEIDNYDMYCGHVCSLVAVDVQAATRAFIKLFNSPDLRQRMGQAGCQRVRDVYDWAVIIPQYEMLWTQLAEIRLAQADDFKLLPHPWPARLDPFHAFASYPTQQLTPQTQFCLVDVDVNIALQRTLAYRRLAMIDFAKAILPSEDELREVLSVAAVKPKSAAELIQSLPASRQPYVFRCLVWLVKLGVLEVCK